MANMGFVVELSLFCFYSVAMAFIEETPRNLKPNLINVYELESSNILLTITKTVVGMSILLRGTTLYFYVGALACMFIPVITNSHPYFYVPWLVVSLVRCVVFNLFLLFSGLCVCLIFAPIKPACMEFIFIKMLEAVIYTYYWMKINRAYVQLCRQTGMKYISFLKHFQNKSEYRRQEMAYRRSRLRTLGNTLPPRRQIDYNGLKPDDSSCSMADSDFSFSTKIDSDFSTKCSQSLDSFFAQATIDWFIKEALLHQSFETDDARYEEGLAERAAKFLGDSIDRRRPRSTALDSEFDAITNILPLQTTHRYHPSQDVEVRTRESRGPREKVNEGAEDDLFSEGGSSEQTEVEEVEITVETEVVEECTETEEIFEIEEFTETEEVLESRAPVIEKDVQKCVSASVKHDDCGDPPGSDEVVTINRSKDVTENVADGKDTDGSIPIEDVQTENDVGIATCNKIDSNPLPSSTGQCLFFGCFSSLGQTVPFDYVEEINPAETDATDQLERSVGPTVSVDHCFIDNNKLVPNTALIHSFENIPETEGTNQSNYDPTVSVGHSLTPPITSCNGSNHDARTVENQYVQGECSSIAIESSFPADSSDNATLSYDRELLNSQSEPTSQHLKASSPASPDGSFITNIQNEFPSLSVKSADRISSETTHELDSLVRKTCLGDRSAPVIAYNHFENKTESSLSNTSLAKLSTVEKTTPNDQNLIREQNASIENIAWLEENALVNDHALDTVDYVCHQSMTHLTKEDNESTMLPSESEDLSSALKQISVDHISVASTTNFVGDDSSLDKTSAAAQVIDQSAPVDHLFASEKTSPNQPPTLREISNAQISQIAPTKFNHSHSASDKRVLDDIQIMGCSKLDHSSSSVVKTSSVYNIIIVHQKSSSECNLKNYSVAVDDQIRKFDQIARIDETMGIDGILPFDSIATEQTATASCSLMYDQLAKSAIDTAIKHEVEIDKSTSSIQTALFDYISATTENCLKLNQATVMNQLPALIDYDLSKDQSEIADKILKPAVSYLFEHSPRVEKDPTVTQASVSNQINLIETNLNSVSDSLPAHSLPAHISAAAHNNLMTEILLTDNNTSTGDINLATSDGTLIAGKLFHFTDKTLSFEKTDIIPRGSTEKSSQLNINTDIESRTSSTDKATTVLGSISTHKKLPAISSNIPSEIENLDGISRNLPKEMPQFHCITSDEKSIGAGISFNQEDVVQIDHDSYGPAVQTEIPLQDYSHFEKPPFVHSINTSPNPVNRDLDLNTVTASQNCVSNSNKILSDEHTSREKLRSDCLAGPERTSLISRVSATGVFQMLMRKFSSTAGCSLGGIASPGNDSVALGSNLKVNDCHNPQTNVPIEPQMSSEKIGSIECLSARGLSLPLENLQIREKALPVDLLSEENLFPDCVSCLEMNALTNHASNTGVYGGLVAKFSRTTGYSLGREKSPTVIVDTFNPDTTSSAQIALSLSKPLLDDDGVSLEGTNATDCQLTLENNLSASDTSKKKSSVDCISNSEEENVKLTPTVGVFQKLKAKFCPPVDSTSAEQNESTTGGVSPHQKSLPGNRNVSIEKTLIKSQASAAKKLLVTPMVPEKPPLSNSSATVNNIPAKKFGRVAEKISAVNNFSVHNTPSKTSFEKVSEKISVMNSHFIIDQKPKASFDKISEKRSTISHAVGIEKTSSSNRAPTSELFKNLMAKFATAPVSASNPVKTSFGPASFSEKTSPIGRSLKLVKTSPSSKSLSSERNFDKMTSDNQNSAVSAKTLSVSFPPSSAKISPRCVSSKSEKTDPLNHNVIPSSSNHPLTAKKKIRVDHALNFSEALPGGFTKTKNSKKVSDGSTILEKLPTNQFNSTKDEKLPVDSTALLWKKHSPASCAQNDLRRAGESTSAETSSSADQIEAGNTVPINRTSTIEFLICKLLTNDNESITINRPMEVIQLSELREVNNNQEERRE